MAFNHRFLWTSDEADRTLTHRRGLNVDIHEHADRFLGELLIARDRRGFDSRGSAVRGGATSTKGSAPSIHAGPIRVDMRLHVDFAMPDESRLQRDLPEVG